VQLRSALESEPDLQVVWVMARRQWNARSLRFVDEYGLRSRIHFWLDPDSRAIDALGLRRPHPEAIEEGVPHPTTVLVDRAGVVRFVDVREDFRFWLAPETIRAAVRALETAG
jgi:peroxiredoxin